MKRFMLGILLAVLASTQARGQATVTVNGSSVCTDPTKPCTVGITIPATVQPITLACKAAPASVAAGTNVALSAVATGASSSLTTVFTWAASGGFTISGSGQNVTASTAGLAPGTYTASCHVAESQGSTIIESADNVVSFVVTASSGPPAGSALSACVPITKSGTYYLASDVTCTNQGFALNANNISFNLNGHTIYYGSTTGAVVPAISICDTWYSSLPQTACGNSQHAAPQIYNGKIVQTKGTTPFSHAIWIGQANGLSAGAIHDLNITIQEPGTEAIYGDYPLAGWKIQNNVINDNVTNIQKSGQNPLSARSQMQGAAIQLNMGSNWLPVIPQTKTPSGLYDVISGNTINGTPQTGIYDTSQNAQIYSNTITLSAYYSNDYGVTVMADGQQVHDNIITGRGRGIDAESSNFVLNHNTISVHEEANNSEYNGCELAGSDGIRIKNYGTPTQNGVVSNNTITVNGKYCEANGIALTQLLGGSLSISGNKVTVIPGPNFANDTSGSGSGYYAIRYDGVTSATNIAWSKNSFTSDIGPFIYWDGANTTIQSGQTWNLGGLYGVVAIDGGPTAFGGGAISLTVQDPLPAAKVFCGANSKATVNIANTSTQCN
jgi:hypothetical protein